MSTLSVDTIQGKTTAGTVAMPAGMIVQVLSTTKTTEQVIAEVVLLILLGYRKKLHQSFLVAKY